ncbi:MAG: T9SS type A sorting domain-containing protein [Calditrichaeota bacterium]|nr:T9SS type A sorting domain-containing protein [Calditrichota bacterium]
MKRLFFTIIIAVVGTLQAQTWQSEIVYFGNDGKLVYVADSLGNRIPDFSYAGYKNSNEPLPNVPTVMSISPISGDNTAHVQAAIDAVSAMPQDVNGFRGALLLTAGIYQIRFNLRINADGVVLRGVGDGDDPASNTILHATGNIPGKRDVIIAGGASSTLWRDSVSATTRNITTDTVFVGDRVFEVSDASPYAVGDNIVIVHPCTEAWLAAIDYGGTHSGEPGSEPEDIPWEVDSQPIVFNRYITAINGNKITIDAPVFNTLIRALSQSYIYKYSRNLLKTNIGIEDLRIDIETAGGTDENHAWSGIYLHTVEDAWVRDCTILHFGHSGVYTNTATRVTVYNCRALDPVSLIDGERRYNFNAYSASQLILFQNCHASFGRHSYVSNGNSRASGIVFLDCTSEGAYAGSEGHRRWSQGLLYDNHRELDGPRSGYNPRRIGLYNRGYFGTSHGWSAAHSITWNCDVNGAEIHVQQPPTAQNYAIGCAGYITGQKPPNSFAEPEGYIEGSNQPGLNPRSLFVAQLAERGGVLTGIDEDQGQSNPLIPEETELYQNYPNPFNPTTTLSFRLPKTDVVQLQVFDVTGRLVQTLVDGIKSTGLHSVIWEAADMSSGIYYYRLNSTAASQTRKMMLLK